MHEESSFLAKKLLDAATASGSKFNLVYDGTLANRTKAVELFKKRAQPGFETHLIGVTVDPKIAMKRAFTRAIKKAAGFQPMN